MQVRISDGSALVQTILVLRSRHQASRSYSRNQFDPEGDSSNMGTVVDAINYSITMHNRKGV
jgi:hypothetical protein